MKLYNYFRSGTSHRTRIAMALKGVQAQYVAVDLLHEAHLHGDFHELNPQALVPALVLDDGTVLTQSPAILEWLEETHPEPPLLPAEPRARAHVRALAALIGCDIHPINNRRILQYLKHQFGADKAAIERWCGEWISTGFDAYEKLLGADGERGDFSWGGRPTLADCYLIPQVASARRFNVDMGRWPLISAIDAACARLPAFEQAAPANQPDAPRD
ncbi:maleylacetoacetate isomerase [Comamonas flocculans]|uniref:Maleylacetoacetate isomerase n=1 Tax=Comamonas flocculans TaxID=2597701 RepID=A0A5B8RX51_9BURK|nr:maleylacetoacetate isomerase [Comamonas flocculans]QEA14141.1 maleylacetoacetate isomerase [Comamonas flocculans]